MDAGAGPVARLAAGALRARLQAGPGAGLAGDQGLDADGLAGPAGRLDKRHAGLHLDVVADNHLLLKRVAAAAATAEPGALSGEGLEEVLEVEVGAEAALRPAPSEAGERVSGAAERIAAHAGAGAGARVEAGGAKLVVLLFLLGIDRISYAAWTSAKRSLAVASLFVSGWNFLASP